MKIIFLCAFGAGAVVAQQEAFFKVDEYNEEALTKLGEFCNREEPGYVPQVNFAILDEPPCEVSDWMSWFRINAKRIVNLARKKKFFTYILIADPDLQFQDKRVADAFGSNKKAYDLKTENNLIVGLDVEDATIILPYIHQLGGSGFRHNLRVFGQAIGRQPNMADFYITQPYASSYGWYFEQDDGILYLVEGTKHFRVAGTEVGSPIVIDVLLQPGDAIYIPAKYYHYAIGGDEQSVLWSIRFRNMNVNYAKLDEKERVDTALLTEETWEEIAARRENIGQGGSSSSSSDEGCTLKGTAGSEKVWLISCGTGVTKSMTDGTPSNHPISSNIYEA